MYIIDVYFKHIQMYTNTIDLYFKATLLVYILSLKHKKNKSIKKEKFFIIFKITGIF